MGHAKKDMLSFFLTTTCNLDCRYCYTNKKKFKHQHLDLDFARYAIDEYFSINKSRHIRFQGAGEPTTSFDRMKLIYEYAKDKAGDQLVVELQTNGTFNENTKKWLANHLDIIWVSCDGTPDIQNYYRPLLSGKPSSGLLEKNVKYLVKHGKGMTGIRMTVSSNVLGRQIECLKYFRSLGVDQVWADPIFPAVGAVKSFDSIDEEKYVDEFLEAVEYAQANGMFYGSILTCNFDEHVEYNCRACLPSPHLTTDGYVSACDMALFGEDKNHMSLFFYGKWDKDNNFIIYDKDKKELLQSRKAGNIPGCLGCSVEDHCAGYCPGEVVNETKNLFGKKETACKMIRYLKSKMSHEHCQHKYLHP